MTAQFSSGDAALYGFSFFKLAPWTILGLVLLAPFYGVAQIILSLWPQLTGLPGQDLPVLGDISLGGAWVVLLIAVSAIVSYGIIFVAEAAILRPLARDDAKGWIFGLKLGMDEVRMLLLSLLFAALFLIFYAILAVVGLTLGFSIGVAAQGVNAPDSAAIAIMIALVIAGLCAVIFVWVRFSPAFAATIGERRIVIMEAWTMSRGHFWGLFGAYILAGLIALGLMIALMGIAAVGTFGFISAVHAFVDSPDGPGGSPVWAIVPFVGICIFGMVYLISLLPTMGVGAYMYRQWKADQTAPDTQIEEPKPVSG